MSCDSLGLLSPKRYEVDLSNEVLYALEAGKISEAKVEGRKKKLPTRPDLTPKSLSLAELADFFSTSIVELKSFYSFLNCNKVKYLPHLKDLVHICLETKGQGF